MIELTHIGMVKVAHGGNVPLVLQHLTGLPRCQKDRFGETMHPVLTALICVLTADIRSVTDIERTISVVLLLWYLWLTADELFVV